MTHFAHRFAQANGCQAGGAHLCGACSAFAAVGVVTQPNHAGTTWHRS